MRRLRLLAALLGAALLAVATGGPGRPIAAAGPPLRYLAGPPGTLDPAFISSAADVQLLLQLYAGLTRLDETGEPYASLAESWRVSDDRLTYTFRLRRDLTFSDGTPLAAADVRRSWLRLLDPATRATAPEVLNLVVGAPERLAGTIGDEEVGIEAPDQGTLVVRLRHPAAYFPEIAATPATFVVPREADASQDWQTATAFVGSGPYVADGTDGADLVLRANPNYVAGPPPIDEVRWMSGVDGDVVTAFADGQVDLAGVPGWDATWLAYDAELGPRLHRAEPLSISYLGFDTSRPPFDDARVRRAFALALDRERLVRLANGARATPAGSLLPSAIWPQGFIGDLASDPAEARRLLDEAGYRDRSALGTIVVNGSALGLRANGGGLVILAIAAAWREELGVEIAVEGMDFADYYAALEDRPPQVFSISWIADYTSPHAIYGLLLHPDALSNYGRWDDPRFLDLLEAAASADGEAARAAAYAAVDARVADQAPVIPWSYEEAWWLVADGLRGLGNLTVGLLDLGRVSWDG